MSSSKPEIVRRYFDALGRDDLDAAMALTTEDVVIDRTSSAGPWRGVGVGRDAARLAYLELREAVADLSWELGDTRPLGPYLVAIATRISIRGRTSGIDVLARGGWLLRFEGDLIAEAILHQSFDEALLAGRRAALAEARLYFVCDGRPNGSDPGALLDAALRGGVDIVQLRDKELDDAGIVAAAASFRAAADRHRALFFLNDRPDLLAACDADGVHVGQDDLTVAEARRIAGPAALVGLSTHSPEQFDAALGAEGAARPDQISAGPVWETPTKKGRPAAGLELVRHAVATAPDAPWFAIGGIDAANVGQVVDAGARRIVVVRAIRDAADPEASAARLRSALDERFPGPPD
jgi:thiamine-phosphate pyrophosphorylase